jgi:hypothetical protein
MTESKRIAGLVGPTLVAISLSEAINVQIWTKVAPPVVYISGTLLFVAGLSIVRIHNRWSFGWPILVTVMGWLALVGGLVRMFAPSLAHTQNRAVLIPVLTILVTIGLILSFKAYADGT